MLSEKIAEKIYKFYLKEVEKVVGSDITYSNTLTRAGRHYFGENYQGTFPIDKQPRLTKTQPYSIVNLDRSGEKGEHWVGLAFIPKRNVVMVYDSFGRCSTKIFEDLERQLGQKIEDVDRDREQKKIENNCGARCLSWLLVFHTFGEKVAKQI